MDNDVNLDSVPFSNMKEYIRKIYSRGGVVTISWHLNNPLTGKTAWDPAEGTMAAVLPGGEKNDLYTSWLDKIADFMLSLKGENGELIPVIFRPFHELNGSWFWWGGKNSTSDELKQLYRFTETYLRDQKNVHNLLYAYNTDRFNSKDEYLEKYPGNEWVDIIGFDIYQRGSGEEANKKFITDIDMMLNTLDTIAQQKNKIPALTEFGFGQIPDSTWWTNVFWKGIQNHQISYALAWRNAGFKPASNTSEFYVPYKGNSSAADFVKLYNEPQMLFQTDIEKEDLYK